MPTLTWLHLTDLHIGMDEQQPFLPTIKREFFDDLKKYLDEEGRPWDLILFTGDLVQQGKEDEYRKLDEFLDELYGQCTGPTPLLAVPGNHDLQRPADCDALLTLECWHLA